MLQVLDRLSDGILSLVVPSVKASADPGCECSSVTTKTTECNCKYDYLANMFAVYNQTQHCDGCHWTVTKSCHKDHYRLWC